MRAGTRSEGRIGRLWHHGVEVPGQVPGESFVVATAAGTTRFTYMGDARRYNWSISGWTNLASQR